MKLKINLWFNFGQEAVSGYEDQSIIIKHSMDNETIKLHIKSVSHLLQYFFSSN